MAKKPAITKALTKSQLMGAIAEETGLTKKEVIGVIESLEDNIHRHLNKKGAGQFTLPGLAKFKVFAKPARKARKGVPNPFKPGELMDIAAKPASTKVKVRPLKNLKDMVM